MAKSKFKIGDSVYSPHFGEGIVSRIVDPKKADYPVEVHWVDITPNTIYAHEYYTLDGQLHTQYPDPEYDIIRNEDDSESGRDIFLVNGKKDEGEEEMKESTGFKLGDRVYAPYHGYGTVTAVLSNTVYPIEVTWDIGCGSGAYTSMFTSDGHLSRFIDKDDTTISVVKEGEGVEDNMEVEAVMAGLTKVDYSPINPSHYQVAGIPEAIDIMKHLMTQEQFKGFLWGNIIKYAYRYGRKGDEHDTAGKIEWYANRLKEVCAEEKKEQERE